MNKERLEYLVNEMYYNYLEQDEAQELVNYINDLQQRIDKAKDFCNKQKQKMYKSRNKIALFVLMKLEKILNETIGE
jgi:DNA polymerase II large subunit